MATKREFDSIEQMNDCLIEIWNNTVNNRDIIYHLGDFGLKNQHRIKKCRYKLKGKIHLIVGNHDIKNNIHKTGWFSSVEQLKTLKINKQKTVLCHYPMRWWDHSHYNSWHCYGHVHSGFDGKQPYMHGKSLDVGIDWWKRPINYDEVVQIMSKLPDNPNLIKRK
jgi:calcineurin-like phosphoesterase family protein